MGAHTVGKVNLENSGYEGHWSSPEEQGKFNNDFYKSLITKGWGPELEVNANPEKNQWRRIDEKGMGDHKEMMLNSDMALVYTSNVKYEHCRRKYQNAFDHSGYNRTQKGKECIIDFLDSANDLHPANDPDCCAWVPLWTLRAQGHEFFNGDPFEFCGVDLKDDTSKTPGTSQCCLHAGRVCLNCDYNRFPQGPAYLDVADFARDIHMFYRYFRMAWNIATENAFTGLKYIDEVRGPQRHVVDDFDEICSALEGWKCDQDPNCMWIDTGYTEFFSPTGNVRKCRSRWVPQSHQYDPEYKRINWMWQYLVPLEKPE